MKKCKCGKKAIKGFFKVICKNCYLKGYFSHKINGFPDFENYLQNKHADQYNGTDDTMIDDYEDWLQELDPQDLIDYANEWGITLLIEK
jgi:hypothetical protein